MRIFSAGDIHGDSLLARKLAKKAKNAKADIVILCGDLTESEKSTDNIIGPFKKEHLKVLLIPGNHESNATADFLSEFYEVKNIHGQAVRYEHIGIIGNSAVNIGLHKIPEKDIFESIKEGFKRVSYLDKKVLVSHVHPEGSKMDHLTPFLPGSNSIKKAIDQFKPDILLCTHVHEAHGLEEKIGKTRVINVGREGKIIDL
jgi:uncharacterized protein